MHPDLLFIQLGPKTYHFIFQDLFMHFELFDFLKQIFNLLILFIMFLRYFIDLIILFHSRLQRLFPGSLEVRFSLLYRMLFFDIHILFNSEHIFQNADILHACLLFGLYLFDLFRQK